MSQVGHPREKDGDNGHLVYAGGMKPAPPPKPSHLSSAFTGTLNSDALKSYIRQQSHVNVSRFHTVHDSSFISSTSPSSSPSSSLNIETFRTTRQQQPFNALVSSHSGDGSVDEADWGTAKQSLSNAAAKPALADLFSPPSLSSPDLALTEQGTFVISGVQTALRESDDSPPPSTIKIKLKANGSHSDSAQGLMDDYLSSRAVRQSSEHSSPHSTLRSRQPSILSRLSSFEDEGDDEEIEARASTSTILTGTALDAASPRKQWMHVRDGSAFERASPRPMGGSKIGSRVQQGSATRAVGKSYGTSSTSGLPSISDGLPILIAGPPPVRPKSIVVPPTEPTKSEEVPPKPFSTPPKRKGEPGKGRQARALYAFEGEGAFNELSLLPGQVFEILKEDVQDGWSLALAEQKGEWTKGLVPQGWYTYVHEFTASPLHKPSEKETLQVPSTLTLHGNSSKDQAERDGMPTDGIEPKIARPASGVGRMSSGVDEVNGAKQLLSRLSTISATTPTTPAKADTTTVSPADSIDDIQTDSIASTPALETASSESSLDITTNTSESVVAADSTSATSVSIPIGIPSKVWRPPGLLGGRSLNRYAPYVTSGAEQYILSSTSTEDGRNSTAQSHVNTTHRIVSGAHSGPAWQVDGPEIVVEVHSPELHLDERDREYTAYAVHTSYVERGQGNDGGGRDMLFDPYVRPEDPTHASSVYRRFNQFRWLSGHLQRYYPAITLTLAPMPSPTHSAGRSARFEAQFVERRRRHLQSWLTSVVRHPVLACDAGLLFFLTSEEEGDDWTWKAKELQRKMRYRDTASSSTHLFARALHPSFNVDAHEADVEAGLMRRFCEVYERTMCAPGNGVLDSIKDTRQTAVNGGESYRQLSLALLGMITGADAAGGETPTNIGAGVTYNSYDDQGRPVMHGVLPPMGNVGKRDGSGATNEDRAWCWREGCTECGRTTMAVQITAAAFQSLADTSRLHAQTGLFDIHDRMWNVSRAQQSTAALFELQKSVMGTYAAATATVEQVERGGAAVDDAERIAARCETTLNVTASELDRIHADRVQQWNALSRQMLDESIAFHAEALHGLQAARQRMDRVLTQDAHRSHGPILPSPYETQLSKPLACPALDMPSMTLVEPGAASKAIRPVAFASEMLSDWLGGVHAIR